MALFDSKIEENADPKIQIKQAMRQEQERHQNLTQQAANVIGNMRQIEMQLNRQIKEKADLEANVKSALSLIDKAVAEGNAEEAQKLEASAEMFASQLVSKEQEIASTQALYEQSHANAEQAKKQVEHSSKRINAMSTEQSQLLSQLEQARMQETVAESLTQMNSTVSNVPNLDSVRAKIESRYAKALGQAELANASPEGRMMEIEQSAIEMRGHSRLEEIRAQMRSDNQLESGGDKTRELEEKPE